MFFSTKESFPLGIFKKFLKLDPDSDPHLKSSWIRIRIEKKTVGSGSAKKNAYPQPGSVQCSPVSSFRDIYFLDYVLCQLVRSILRKSGKMNLIAGPFQSVDQIMNEKIQTKFLTLPTCILNTVKGGFNPLSTKKFFVSDFFSKFVQASPKMPQ